MKRPACALRGKTRILAAEGKRRGMMRFATYRAAIAAFLLLLPGVAAAQSVEQFYRSHTMTMIVGLPAGSAYDIYSRAIARHLNGHIPGNPTIIVQNMPGAGSLTSINHLYNQAAKDGSVIATFIRGLPLQPLLDKQGIRFEAQKLNWIGSPSTEVSTLVSWATGKFKTIQDAMANQMVVGGSSPGADNIVFPAVMNGVLHTKFKIVMGYQGAGPALLAMESGEVDGTSASWTNIAVGHADWLRDHKINVLVQLSTEKRQDIPAPLVTDLAGNAADKQVMALFFARNVLGYPFAAPPGIPADRLAALRDAFDATMRDPDFLAEAKKEKLEIHPSSGAALAKLVQEIYATPQPVIERAQALIAEDTKK
jgi:tripartite-type tricarboxylate transporter receptor subunit TctC